MTLPRLYGELAEWWHLLSAPEDYEEEAKIFIATFDRFAPRPIETMLELGSGGGNNASHMKQRYQLTLTDLSEQMLDQSRKLNPECEHIPGDMRCLRLDRTFDAVFVHDAIQYMTTESDLEDAMRTAFVHLASPGVAVFVPDDTTETIRRSAHHGGHDGENRSIRYTYRHDVPAPGATTYEAQFRYTIREGERERTMRESHTFGVFPRDTWLRLLENLGFEPTTTPFEHSEFAPGAKREIFVGLKP